MLKIPNSQPLPLSFPLKQQGFATLLVILVLLVGMTTVSLIASRANILEQAISSNDTRSQEAQKAAEAGLEYIVAWMATQPNPWSTSNGKCSTKPSNNDPGCPTLPTLKGDDNGEFEVLVIFEHNPPIANYVRIASTASQADNNSKAMVSCYIKWEGTNPPFKIMRIPGTWKDF